MKGPTEPRDYRAPLVVSASCVVFGGIVAWVLVFAGAGAWGLVIGAAATAGAIAAVAVATKLSRSAWLLLIYAITCVLLSWPVLYLVVAYLWYVVTGRSVGE